MLAPPALKWFLFDRTGPPNIPRASTATLRGTPYKNSPGPPRIDVVVDTQHPDIESNCALSYAPSPGHPPCARPFRDLGTPLTAPETVMVTLTHGKLAEPHDAPADPFIVPKRWNALSRICLPPRQSHCPPPSSLPRQYTRPTKVDRSPRILQEAEDIRKTGRCESAWPCVVHSNPSGHYSL